MEISGFMHVRNEGSKLRCRFCWHAEQSWGYPDAREEIVNIFELVEVDRAASVDIMHLY